MSVSVARLGDGTYVVSPRFQSPALLHYDATGRLLRLFDAHGGGPNELRSFADLYVGYGDTLYAFNAHRVTLFHASLMALGSRTMELVPNSKALIYPDGRMIVDGRLWTNDDAVLTFHLLDSHGNLLRSYEPTRNVIGPPVLAKAGSEHLWVVNMNDSELRQYNLDGTLVRRMEIRRDWFEPWQGRLAGEPWSVPPRPRNTAMAALSGGQLLLITRIADERWRPMQLGPRMRPAELDPALIYDSIVEIVRASNGEVIGKLRAPELLFIVEGTTNEVYATHQDAMGAVTVQIWRVTFADPN